jgi:hypothetical protein
MPNTTAGVTYPTSGGNVQLWTHFQTMADSMTNRLRPVFADIAARDTAFPTPTFGDEACVQSTGEWYWHNGIAWVSKQPRLIYKTAGESLTANNTMQDDDHLFFSVETVSRYRYRGMLWIATGSTTPDIKFTLSGPTSSLLSWTISGADNATSAVDFGAFDAVSGTVTTNIKERPTSSGGPFGYTLEGVITTAGTAGNLRLRWAEITASNTTTISANSFLEVWKYA